MGWFSRENPVPEEPMDLSMDSLEKAIQDSLKDKTLERTFSLGNDARGRPVTRRLALPEALAVAFEKGLINEAQYSYLTDRCDTVFVTAELQNTIGSVSSLTRMTLGRALVAHRLNDNMGALDEVVEARRELESSLASRAARLTRERLLWAAGLIVVTFLGFSTGQLMPADNTVPGKVATADPKKRPSEGQGFKEPKTEAPPEKPPVKKAPIEEAPAKPPEKKGVEVALQAVSKKGAANEMDYSATVALLRQEGREVKEAPDHFEVKVVGKDGPRWFRVEAKAQVKIHPKNGVAFVRGQEIKAAKTRGGK